MSNVKKKKKKKRATKEKGEKNQHFQSAAQTGERLRVSFVDTSFRRERDHVLDQLFVPRPSIFIPSCTVVKIAISPHHRPSAHLSDHHKLHAPWTGMEHVASVQPLQQVAIIKCPRCLAYLAWPPNKYFLSREKSSRRFILRVTRHSSYPPSLSLSLFFCLFHRIDIETHSCPARFYRYIIDSFYPKIVVLSVSHWYFYCAYEGIVWLYRVKVHATLSLFFFFKFEQRKIFCYLYNFSSQEIIANHEQLFIMHFECKRIL